MSDISTCVTEVREAFAKGLTKPSKWRKSQLKALDRLLVENEQAITGALRDDLGKHPSEAYTTEISIVRGEISHTLSHLGRWLAPKPVKPSIAVLPANAYTILEPLGVALIIAPWNYPVQLLLGPLVGAIAAGNSVILKPSELAPRTSTLIATLVPRYLDTRAIRVVEGAVEETTALLEEKFDHIFYTGNGRVARIVMAAAAKNLTPVTLELGGKSPTYVDETADLDAVAKRLAWGKFVNAGQTCVAANRFLVHRSVAEEFTNGLRAAFAALVVGHGLDESVTVGPLINDDARASSEQLVDAAVSSGADLAFEGSVPSALRGHFTAPVVLANVPHTSPIVGTEIFGPVAPIVVFDSEDEAIKIANGTPFGLVAYAYTRDLERARRLTTGLEVGMIGLNRGMVSDATAPFGGLKASGLGKEGGDMGLAEYLATTYVAF